MPRNIFLMQWDPRRGPLVLGYYTPSEEAAEAGGIDKDFLINVFGMVLQRGERLEGFYDVTYQNYEIVTYYSGQELNQLFGVVLREGEDKKGIRGGVVRAALTAFRRGEPPVTEEEWRDLWDRISAFPTMSFEERLADAFRDDEARKLLEIMLDNGIMVVDRLLDSLKTSFPFLPRDVLLTYVYLLEALGVLSTKWDEKALIERVYLLRDVVFYRRKPEKFDEIASAISDYSEEFERFAREYQENGWVSDQALLPNVLGDPNQFQVIKAFRELGIMSENEVATRGITSIVEKLVSIDILRRKDDQYYLFSDPTVKLLLPKYTFANVVKRLRDEELTKDVVIDYLKTVRESYL
ncbi:MAG: hypothetical protein ACP6IP_02705 [Candidatus Njordarchaeia archaeon]